MARAGDELTIQQLRDKHIVSDCEELSRRFKKISLPTRSGNFTKNPISVRNSDLRFKTKPIRTDFVVPQYEMAPVAM